MAADLAWLTRTYHEQKHELLTVAVHLMGERAAGEDLVHDVFVAFARREPGSTALAATASREETRRYLVTSCIHRARDLKRRRAAQLDDGASGGALGRAPAGDGDALAQAMAGDESERVRAALRALPDEQRQVVTLHLHGGLKFREIAAELAIPLDTATSRYRYALEKLRQKLAAKGVSR